MTTDITLKSVAIETIIDDHPDLSYLGEFRDSPGPVEKTIDRYERGVVRTGDYRYFVAQHGPEETGNPDSVEEDWQRMEAYGSEWWSIGIKAIATIRVTGVTQTLTSDGVWGVESDSPDEYLERIAQTELNELRAVLDGIGIDVPDQLMDSRTTSFPVEGTISLHGGANELES